jgi:hypothetical protein
MFFQPSEYEKQSLFALSFLKRYARWVYDRNVGDPQMNSWFQMSDAPWNR